MVFAIIGDCVGSYAKRSLDRDSSVEKKRFARVAPLAAGFLIETIIILGLFLASSHLYFYTQSETLSNLLAGIVVIEFCILLLDLGYILFKVGVSDGYKQTEKSYRITSRKHCLDFI